jgi:hypothetical protein
MERTLVFRITQVDRQRTAPAATTGGSQPDDSTTLRVEGALTSDCLADFHRACAPALERPVRLSLDVSGVTFLDEAAIQALRLIRRSGARITGSSPFIRELLKERP